MTRRIAVISDVHGNYTALQSVLEDAWRQGVSEHWVLGDVFMPGTGGADIFDLLHSVNVSAWVRGNWDDGLVDAVRGNINVDDPTDVYCARLAMYVHQTIGDEGVAKIASWPLTLTKQVEGLSVQLSHNLPQQNYGGGLMPSAPQDSFADLFVGSDADVAIVGHTHCPLMRNDRGRLIINPGAAGISGPTKALRTASQVLAAGEPAAGAWLDRGVQYVVLAFGEQGIEQIDFRSVWFDVADELRRAYRLGLPYTDLYREQLETGVTHTHDVGLLDQSNRRNGYRIDVREFIAARRGEPALTGRQRQPSPMSW